MIDEWSHDRTGWARFSDDRKFRYRLGRALTPAGLERFHRFCPERRDVTVHPSFTTFDKLIVGGEVTEDGRLVQRIKRIVFLLINPSDATAFKPDPTVSRCVKFAQRWGGDILEVVNLFALRSPYPEDVWAAVDRGDDIRNDAAILDACTGAARVIAGWGANGWRYSRAENVCDKLKTAGVTLEHLGTSGGGFPKHPLARGKHRIPDDVEPMPYEWRAA